MSYDDFENFDDFEEEQEPLDPEKARTYYSNLIAALEVEPEEILDDIEAIDHIIQRLDPFAGEMDFTLHFMEYPWMFTTGALYDHLEEVERALDLGGIIPQRVLDLKNLVGKTQQGIQRDIQEMNTLYSVIQLKGLDRYIIEYLTDEQISISTKGSVVNEGPESVEILGKVKDLYLKLRGQFSAEEKTE